MPPVFAGSCSIGKVMGYFACAHGDFHSSHAAIHPKNKESFGVHAFGRAAANIVAGSFHVGLPRDYFWSISGRLRARRRLGLYFRRPNVVANGRRVTYFRVHRGFVRGQSPMTLAGWRSFFVLFVRARACVQHECPAAASAARWDAKPPQHRRRRRRSPCLTSPR